MRIANAELHMDAEHSQQQSHDVSSSLRRWSADRSAGQAEQNQRQTTATPLVQLSNAGMALQSSEAGGVQESIDAVENDPTLRMIRSLISMLTGTDIKATNFRKLHLEASTYSMHQFVHAQSISMQSARTPAQQPAASGIEYTQHETYSESEQTSFAASGVVNTADGRQISFSLALSMTRSYHEESSVSIRFGDAPPTQDPLVVNFDGNAAQLTDQRYAFDLDADGDQESINFAAGGSGFLALDRNGDGRINNGTELFGVQSGNGFADLAALDSDHNGWIDENDAAYQDLRIWTKDANGADILSTLAQADVGAIALAHVATPFDLKEASNELQGQIRSSGIFLHENGNIGTIQQVDLTI